MTLKSCGGAAPTNSEVMRQTAFMIFGKTEAAVSLEYLLEY